MAVTLRASVEGLAMVDLARRKKGWTATAYQWCRKAQVSVATLKRFRRRIPIQQELFISICQAVEVNWEEVLDNHLLLEPASLSTNPDQQTEFAAYDEFWVGRLSLVADLIKRVKNSCRILVITGMTGIGKTALAERLVVELRPDWPQFHEEKFDDEHETQDFVSVAVRWLEQWGEPITPEERQNTEQLRYRLVHKLRKEPYLVVMDALENILEGNEEDGWSDFQDQEWVKFFEQLLGAPTCASRLMLTSQDFPGQLSERYQNFWFCCVVEGLEATERLALFEKTGLEIESETTHRSYLERIGKAYEGHPLALRVIAGEIGSPRFGGDAGLYWEKYGHEIEEVEKALAEAREGITMTGTDPWHLHNYTKELRKRVRARLERTFERLKQDFLNAYRLLCEASVYRCAVPEDFWLSHLEYWDCNQDECELALEALRDRYLVEDEKTLLRQHNLIRSIALDHLKAMDDE